jgi:hypothetical protein
MNEIKKRPQLITNAIAAVMLLIAIAPMPDSYYSVLRWVVCLASLHLEALGFYWRKHKTLWVIIVFGCVAILFNPINIADLSKLGIDNSTKAMWIVLDLAFSVLFLITAFSIEKPPQKAWLIKPPDSDEDYGFWRFIGGLLGAAFFTSIAFIVLMLVHDALEIFH